MVKFFVKCVLGLCVACACTVLPAQEWVSSRVYGPFACWGTFDLTPIEPDLKFLPMISAELIRRLELPVPEEWIELYVFADEIQWKEFLEREYPQIPYRRALFLKKKKGRGQLFLHLSENFAEDVRHEGTHAFLHAVLSDVPIWLDEGLAEYFETAPAEGTDQSQPDPRITDADWFPLVLERAQKNEIAKLADLEALHEMQEMTSLRYADSWAWVNFLLNGPENVRPLLPLYVSELLKRKALAVFPVTPISRRLSKVNENQNEDPNNALNHYLKKLRPHPALDQLLHHTRSRAVGKPET